MYAQQRLRSDWLIRVVTVRLKIDMILSYSLSAQWRLWSDWASAHCRLTWVFAGLTCQFVGFVTNGRVIFGNDAVEKIYVLGTSFRFQKSWSTVTINMTENVVLLLLFIFVYVPCMRFIAYMFVYHFGRIWCFASIICKKRILWKYSTQSLKAADAVHSFEIMADATFFTPPSWALLCSQISVEPHIPKGPANVKITTLYRCTVRLFRAATRAQRQLFLVLFLLCFLVGQVRTCTFYMCPVTQKRFSGMVDLVCFKPAWSATKAS